MGFRKFVRRATGSVRKATRQVLSKTAPDKFERESMRMMPTDDQSVRVFEFQKATTDPLGSAVHRERTRTGGELNSSIGDEEEVLGAAETPQELVDEEAARKARRRARARQRSGRNSTILTGGTSDSLGGG